jgi:hypothetical protein
MSAGTNARSRAVETAPMEKRIRAPPSRAAWVASARASAACSAARSRSAEASLLQSRYSAKGLVITRSVCTA